jgi:hypothetical protein
MYCKCESDRCMGTCRNTNSFVNVKNQQREIINAQIDVVLEKFEKILSSALNKLVSNEEERNKNAHDLLFKHFFVKNKQADYFIKDFKYGITIQNKFNNDGEM